MREQVFLGGKVEGVGGSCEASQPVLVYVNAQGIPAGDGDVDSHVEFQPIRKERVVDVLADDDAIFLLL
jgi:hypothetical protein